MDDERRYIIGVDPGLSGGLAFFTDKWKLLGVRRMPLVANTKGRGKVIDCHQLALYLQPFQNYPTTMVLEAVNSQPRDGVASAFKFGRASMAPEAIAIAFGFQIEKISPASWKKKAKLIKKDKDASRALAKELFPDKAAAFLKKVDEGVAEAVLIAYFGKEVSHGENKEAG